MNVITAADDLREFLENYPGHLACVHSVFPHAANLLVREDELITLTNQDDITPMGLLVDNRVSFAQHLKPGDKLVLDVHQLTSTNGIFEVNLQGAELWQTSPWMKLIPRPIEEVAKLNYQLRKWLLKQPSVGLLPVLPRLRHCLANSALVEDNLYSRYIADDLETFTIAIQTSDWEHALKIADHLVGFGMGSTPACDDFLAAYLVIFKIADVLNPGRFPWIRDFNAAIANKAKKRTTLVSANMLRHAGDGKTGRSYQKLIQTCLFKEKNDLEYSASQVLEHGATSGGDFLFGLVCALEWYRNTLINYPKEGEKAWVESSGLQSVPTI